SPCRSEAVFCVIRSLGCSRSTFIHRQSCRSGSFGQITEVIGPKKIVKNLANQNCCSGIQICLVRGVSKHVDWCETSESRKEGAECAFRKGSTGWSRPVDRSRTASPSHELGPQVCPQH